MLYLTKPIYKEAKRKHLIRTGKEIRGKDKKGIENDNKEYFIPLLLEVQKV